MQARHRRAPCVRCVPVSQRSRTLQRQMHLCACSVRGRATGGRAPPPKGNGRCACVAPSGLTLAAQAHRYHFDRKHPADLNRGFGRQEEPRRNGSHLVCLSESERRRRLRRRRELLRGYISPELPPFPRPLPRPPSPPQATQPARLPAQRKVRYSGGPPILRLPPPPPSPPSCCREAGLVGGRGREKAALAAPRAAGRASSPGAPASARPFGPRLALGRDPRSPGPPSSPAPRQMVLARSAAQKAVPPPAPRGATSPRGPEAARGRRGRGGGLNEPALGTGPPTPRVKMAVSEDAGFGAAAPLCRARARGSEPWALPWWAPGAGGRRRAHAGHYCCSLFFFFFF